jgi:hypothetical protein
MITSQPSEVSPPLDNPHRSLIMSPVNSLILAFILAKVCGIIGVFAFLGHHVALGIAFLLIDGILLAYTTVGAYKAMIATNNLPIEKHPNANQHGYISD